MQYKLLFLILIICSVFLLPFTVFSQQEVVRMVYFHGKDRQIQQNEINEIKTKMTDLATKLLDIYDGLVFEKSNDEYVVHIVEGRRDASDYILGQGILNLFAAEPDLQILDEIREEENFDMSKDLYLVVANVDNPNDICGVGGTVIGQDFGDRFWSGKQPFKGAWALIYESTVCVDELSVHFAAHELGHAFGLLHDFRDPSHIMSYGITVVKDSNGNIQSTTTPDKLSPCAIEWLKASRFFNANSSTVQQGTLSVSSKIYYQDTKELHLQLTGTSVDDLHQIQLHVIPSVIPDGFHPNDPNRDSSWLKLENKYSLNSCHTFEQTQGNKNKVVLRNVSLSKNSRNNLIKLHVIDINGNIAFGDISADTIEFKDAPMTVGTTAEQQVVTDQPNATDVSQESRLRATLNGHTDFVSSLAFSPNGSKLVSGSWDNSIKLWNPQTTANIATGWHAHDVTSVTYSPDGLRIASCGVDEVIRLWNSDAKTIAITYTTQYHGTFTSVVFIYHPDSRYYRVAAANDLDDGIDYFNYYGGGNLDSRYYGIGEHATSSLAVSPDQSMLATGGSKWDTNVALWDPYDGELLKVLKGHTDFVTSVAFSPDRRTLASGSWDNTVRLWNIADGKPTATLRGHTDRVLSVAFSPDGRTLASGGDDQTIRLWDVATHRQKDTLLGHTSGVTSLAFNPNRITYMLASAGGWDNTVRLWDLSPAPTPAPTVSIAPSPVVSPTVGKEFVIKVDIAGVQDVAGYQATVHFDPTALRYVESVNGTYLPTGSLFVPPVVRANQVTVAATSLSEESDGAGTLATLTFEVVAVKPSQITLSDVMIMQQDLTSIPIIVKNGDVVVSSEEALDVNGDGVVNIQDLTLVATHFGKIGENQVDVNGDHVVDIKDLLLVAGGINADAAAPSTYSMAISTLTVEEIQMWLSQAQQLDLSHANYQRGVLILRLLIEALTPKETVLLQNYPNPFNPETWMPYQLSEPADVSVSIYTLDGKLVRTLNLGHQSIGIYQGKSRAAYWDGKNGVGEPVASGVYFYTLKAGDFTATRKMLIRK